MTWHQNIAVWPGELPDRPVPTAIAEQVCYQVEDDTVTIGWGALHPRVQDAGSIQWPWDCRPQCLPDGFYWRELFELDLGSLEAISAFCSEYGVPFLDRPDFQQSLRVHVAELQADTRLVLRADVPAEEIRDAVRVLRNAVRIMQFNDGTLGAQEFVESWEPCDPRGAVPPFSAGSFSGVVPDHLLQTSNLSLIISAGVAQYVPTVTYFFSDAHQPPQPTASLFAATCAQLFNVISQGRSWHTCDRCHRPFIRKWDTQSAKYCTKACAQAAASKAYRESRPKGAPESGAKKGQKAAKEAQGSDER